jgi:hypothetical protein
MLRGRRARLASGLVPVRSRPHCRSRSLAGSLPAPSSLRVQSSGHREASYCLSAPPSRSIEASTREYSWTTSCRSRSRTRSLALSPPPPCVLRSASTDRPPAGVRSSRPARSLARSRLVSTTASFLALLPERPTESASDRHHTIEQRRQQKRESKHTPTHGPRAAGAGRCARACS